jgi:hypothetical protein
MTDSHAALVVSVWFPNNVLVYIDSNDKASLQTVGPHFKRYLKLWGSKVDYANTQLIQELVEFSVPFSVFGNLIG